MQNTIIYIVTSGEYSDYSIDGVFSSRELAEAAAVTLGYKTQIEEYHLNKLCDDNPVYWCVSLDNRKNRWSTEQYNYIPEGRTINTVHLHRFVYDGNKFTDYSILVKTSTEDAALKIANEKISQAIAEDKYVQYT